MLMSVVIRHTFFLLTRCQSVCIGKTQMVPAHETSISAIALNSDGSRLATASEQGTVIRIFNTSTGKPLQELRRGKDRYNIPSVISLSYPLFLIHVTVYSADIFSINFNVTTEWLACSSDRVCYHYHGSMPVVLITSMLIVQLQ
jgi:WD40 repeat protein